ncbi:hypothetical protein CCHR01_07659 [Colletotrichum chrysophilum]|uniref:Uncharacterized protein n=1 Tax=Colletotrichum chrysophilum TaxID=1836956 RepID=A0AAD9ALP3_9PEZI|nr:hypothetical protein CCHR01_07659 [Colletotrichum chrysophilum]
MFVRRKTERRLEACGRSPDRPGGDDEMVMNGALAAVGHATRSCAAGRTLIGVGPAHCIPSGRSPLLMGSWLASAYSEQQKRLVQRAWSRFALHITVPSSASQTASDSSTARQGCLGAASQLRLRANVQQNPTTLRCGGDHVGNQSTLQGTAKYVCGELAELRCRAATHAVRVCRRGVSAQRPYVTPPGSDGMIDAPIAEMESPTS